MQIFSRWRLAVPSKSKPKTTRTLQIVHLESRALPATASLIGGTFAVTGTSSNDLLTVIEQNGRMSVTSGGKAVKIWNNGAFKTDVGVSAVAKVFVDAGKGDDVIDCSSVHSVPCQLKATSGNNVLKGGQLRDSIYGGSGSDTIFGGNGSDELHGGALGSEIHSGSGSSTIYGSTGNDTILGGSGNDLIYDAGGNNIINGGDGNDTVYAGNGNNTVDGGAGNDLIYGGTGTNVINGGDGNDTIHVGNGDATVNGGAGDDVIFGGNGVDFIHGGGGNNTILGGSGSDFIYAESGNNLILAGNASSGFPNIISAGTGNDTIYANASDIIQNASANTTVNTNYTPGNNNNGGNNNNNGGNNNNNGGNNNGNGTGGGSNSSGSVFQTIRSNWGSGDTNDITVQNTGTSTMNGWTVEFDATFNITDVWNAQLVSHVGNHYKISNIPNFWNSSIKAGNQITFGFNTTLSPTDDTAIQNILLNGKPLSNTPPPPPTPNPNTKGTVTQSIRAQWNNGTTNDITITNTGTSTIKGWTITFTADFNVTDVWNSVLVGHNGNTWTISNIPGFWNTNIAPGKSIVIGFNTSFSPGNSLQISNVTLNGNPV
jgi:hypothetical protein